MKMPAFAALASAILFAPLFAQPGRAQGPDTIIIMDGSGSMWGRIDGRPKLEIARETAAEALAATPADRVLGLMAYGHRRRGDCGDIELVVPPAAGSSGAIRAAIERMRFQGRTPLTESVRQAAEVLRSTEAAATIVLVTDCIETCGGDPCALAAELAQTGVDFTAHVIGFGLTRDEGAQVACIAENTGGRYYDARDAASLANALASAVAATGAPPPPEPEPETAPEPERSRHFPGAELMPQAALTPTGGAFGPDAPYPADISFPEDGTIDQCRAACDGDEACGSWRFEPPGSFFVASARCFLYARGTEFDLGFYGEDEGWASGMKEGVTGLLRPYVPIGARDVEVTLEVIGPVAAGKEFTVIWRGPANAGDWIDLADEGESDPYVQHAYFMVNDGIEPGDAPEGAATLVAPAEPGAYVLRYVLGRNVDVAVVHSAPVIVEAR